MSEHQAALDTLSYGVYIITCKVGERANGLTAAWATQVSGNPRLVAVAVHKKWFSHKLLSESDHFVFHVLAEDQTELGKHFGSVHGWDEDKFEGVEWEPGIDGIPVIQGCRTVMECRKAQEVHAGDHTIFIGEVMSSKVDEAKKEQVLDREVYFG